MTTYKKTGKTDLLKIRAGKIITLAKVSDVTGTINFPHNLGYYPGYKAFFQLGTDPTLFCIPNSFSAPLFTAKIKSMQVYFFILNNNINIIWINLGAADQTLTIYYMLYSNRSDV